jgi:hypothetical protein
VARGSLDIAVVQQRRGTRRRNLWEYASNTDVAPKRYRWAESTLAKVGVEGSNPFARFQVLAKEING